MPQKMPNGLIWTVLAAITGFVLGGSFVWSFQPPPPAWYHIEHAADWFVAAFTFMLVVVTGGLVWSTNRLWLAGERQYALAGVTAQRQLRAYISLKSARLDGFKVGSDPIATIEFINGGQTPAHDVTLMLTIAVDDAPYQNFLVPVPDVHSRSALGAGRILKNRVNLNYILAWQDCEAIVHGRLELFVWGVLSYLDIFDVRHETTVRFQYRSEAAARGATNLSVCNEGNSAS